VTDTHVWRRYTQSDALPADARFMDRWCFMAKDAVCTVIKKYDPQARGRELELVSTQPQPQPQPQPRNATRGHCQYNDNDSEINPLFNFCMFCSTLFSSPLSLPGWIREWRGALKCI